MSVLTATTVSTAIAWSGDHVRHEMFVEPMLRELGASLDPFELVTDVGGDSFSSWRCERLAWLAGYPSDTSHHLVLEDDVILCNHFSEAVRRALSEVPEAIVTFYSNRLEVGVASPRFRDLPGFANSRSRRGRSSTD